MGYDFNCPTCQHDDQVQRVPAIQATGTSTYYGTDYYSGIGISAGGLIPTFGSATIERTHSTRLAQSLAPEPVRQRSGRLVGFGFLLLLPALIVAVACVAGALDTRTNLASPLFFLLFSIVLTTTLATPSLLLFTVAIRRDLRYWRILKGRPAARHVWSAACYCHRCGLCFWPYPVAPGIPARQPLSPDQFRWIVWRAGGYAKR